MSKKERESYFIVTYRDPKDGKISTLKALNLSDSGLGLSFVSISNFLFDTDALVVTPEEESLEKRFRDVKNLHLSIYTIISIEEIGQRHRGLKFEKDKSNLLVLPTGQRNEVPKD